MTHKKLAASLDPEPSPEPTPAGRSIGSGTYRVTKTPDGDVVLPGAVLCGLEAATSAPSTRSDVSLPKDSAQYAMDPEERLRLERLLLGDWG